MSRQRLWIKVALALGLIVIAGALWIGERLIAPARARMDAAPASLAAESVSFASASGATLAGWYVAGLPACPSIVLMHPLRGNRQAMIGRAEFLARVLVTCDDDNVASRKVIQANGGVFAGVKPPTKPQEKTKLLFWIDTKSS